MPTLEMKTTKVFNDLAEAWEENYRLYVLYGGSSSSKTISILQWLTIFALQNPRKTITIIGENTPVIKRTVVHDWQTIVMGDLFEMKNFNRTDLIYTFPNRSIIQFLSGDEPSKFHGPRHDVAYFDEIFYIPRPVFDQVSIRTRYKLLASFNPRADFWLRSRMDEKDTWVNHSTYLDNPYAGDAVRLELERRMATDPNFYKVYSEGKWGTLDGLIFEEGLHWNLMDDKDMPKDDEGELMYGVDFGYSVDPAAILKINYTRGKFFVHEICYKLNMLNSDIAELLPKMTKIIADSAEPKSIQELRTKGLAVYGAVKGPDSVNNGITAMKEFEISVSRSSMNLTKELRNYHWDSNRRGETTTKPKDTNNHAIDALRYCISHIHLRRPSWVLS